MELSEQITPCGQCSHLLGHHGPCGCEHTPGYDDPYAHPSYYAGEPGDCDCDHPAETQVPSGGRVVPGEHGDDIPVMLSPGMPAKEIVEHYGEDLALKINSRRKPR